METTTLSRFTLYGLGLGGFTLRRDEAYAASREFGLNSTSQDVMQQRFMSEDQKPRSYGHASSRVLFLGLESPCLGSEKADSESV